MKSILKTTIFTAILWLTTFTVSGQANLTIVNNSMRSMTVKVMQEYGASVFLYKTVTIGANSRNTIYFDESGNYFTKTKAVITGRDPVYRKGELFEVINNSSGYSEMTLTFTIVESAISQASGGKPISESEFNRN